MENISFWWAVCWILSLPPILYPKNLSGYVAVVEYERVTRSAEYTVYTSKRALSSSVLFKQKINRYESRTGIKVSAHSPDTLTHPNELSPLILARSIGPSSRIPF